MARVQTLRLIRIMEKLRLVDSIKMYLLYAKACIRSKLQYRASFIMLSVGQFVTLFMEFFAVSLMFQRFGNLRGWSLPEVASLYGVTHISFSLAEGLGRGFDQFSGLIREGGFDRLLVRPRNVTLQVAGSAYDGRIGRLATGSIALGWAVLHAHISWNVQHFLLLASMILGATCLFYGLFVFQATLCFWTVESLEVMNAVTYGGTETGQYPLSIYRPWFRNLFTYVIPLGCVIFLPATLLLGRSNETLIPSPLLWIAPFVGVGFLLITMKFWNYGVSHYCSTGS